MQQHLPGWQDNLSASVKAGLEFCLQIKPLRLR
jgi:hypothetical protein